MQPTDAPLLPDLAKMRTTPRYRSLVAFYKGLEKVDVKAHESHSKTGKVFDVQQHQMTVDKKAVVAGVAEGLKADARGANLGRGAKQAQEQAAKAPKRAIKQSGGTLDAGKTLMKHRQAGALQSYGNRAHAEVAASHIQGAQVFAHGGAYHVATRAAAKDLKAAGLARVKKGEPEQLPDVSQLAPDHLTQAGNAIVSHLRTLPPGSPEHAHVNTQFEAVRKMVQSWNGSKGETAKAEFPMPEAPKWAGGEKKLTSPKQFELAAVSAKTKEDAFELGHYLNALRAKNGHTGPEWDAAWAEVKHAIARLPSGALQGVLADKRKNKAKLDAEFTKLSGRAEAARAKAENFGQKAADAADAAKPAATPGAKKAGDAKQRHRQAEAEAKQAEAAVAKHGEKVQSADDELTMLHGASGPSAPGQAIPPQGGQAKPGKPNKPGQPKPIGKPGGAPPAAGQAGNPALMVPTTPQRGPKGPGETTTPASLTAPPITPDHIGRAAAAQDPEMPDFLKPAGKADALDADDFAAFKARRKGKAAQPAANVPGAEREGIVGPGRSGTGQTEGEAQPTSKPAPEDDLIKPVSREELEAIANRGRTKPEPAAPAEPEPAPTEEAAKPASPGGDRSAKPAPKSSDTGRTNEQIFDRMTDDGHIQTYGSEEAVDRLRERTPDSLRTHPHVFVEHGEEGGSSVYHVASDEGAAHLKKMGLRKLGEPEPVRKPKAKPKPKVMPADENQQGGQPADEGGDRPSEPEQKAPGDRPEGEPSDDEQPAAPKKPKAPAGSGNDSSDEEDEPKPKRRGWAQPAPKPGKGGHGASGKRLLQGVRDILGQIMSEERGENLRGGTRA